MKEYFAKYLPVDGKIEEHTYAILDSNYNNASIVRVMSTRNHYSNVSADGNSWDTMTSRLKPVKLFLCSKDIQVGDIVYELGLEFEGLIMVVESKDTVFEQEDYSKKPMSWITLEHALKGAYKPIGEVSCDAIWVKEGMEFDKEDLLANGVGVNWDNSSKGLKFKVKCPSCNTFH